MSQNFDIQKWGLIPFRQAWKQQEELVKEIQKGNARSTLVLCQHPTVITIGRNGGMHNIVASQELLADNNVEIIPINRGGDITLHNPGQLIGYPIFRLTDFKEDLHWFLRNIEQAIINVLANFGLNAGQYPGYTGVWLQEERKICAIGLHCSRWVTSHGFALNCSNDISAFNWIIPCGIQEKEVTSLQKELNDTIDLTEIEALCIQEFTKIF
jgi:lipoyl(octanoyl) transferase